MPIAVNDLPNPYPGRAALAVPEQRALQGGPAHSRGTGGHRPVHDEEVEGVWQRSIIGGSGSCTSEGASRDTGEEAYV